MASCVLILSNSDSGLYDFRKEVLQALLNEGRRVLRIPDTWSAYGSWAVSICLPLLRGGA